MSQGAPSYGPSLRRIVAPNPGPFTLEGTNSWMVGRRHRVVIDPGPDHPEHLDRLADACADSDSVSVVSTHHHADHRAAIDPLIDRLGPMHVSVRAEPGARIATDSGALEVVATPGHSQDHVAFWLEDTRMLFCGDLMLGRGDTTWVGEYPGCVADYLASLDRIEALAPRVILPGHGPDLVSPASAIRRYRAHRHERIAQVRSFRDEHPDDWRTGLFERVYGSRVPKALESAARRSLEALADYVDTHG